MLLLFFWRGPLNWLETFYILPGGFGAGVVGSATYIAVAASLDTSLTAIASSSQYLAQSIGQVGGLSAASAVMRILLNKSLWQSLQGRSDAGSIIDKATNDVDYVQKLDGVVKELVTGSYGDSFKGIHGKYLTKLAVTVFTDAGEQLFQWP